MAAERIVLVEAGDHGRGALEILMRIGTAEVVGFADDDPSAPPVVGIPVLGTTDWLVANLASLDAKVLLAIAAPRAKRKLAAKLDAAGARWATAVHPALGTLFEIQVMPPSVDV